MDLNRAIARAKRIEEKLRERAFLPVGEEINGVEVLQFSLRHCILCFKMRSPFFYGGQIEIGDVGLFLWTVSPNYSATDNDKRSAFLSQLLRHPRWHLFYRAIHRYLERAFMDRPPTIESGKVIAASYAASMIHKIASAYHWDDESILDKPIARLFQYIKWIEVAQNPSTPQFNPIQDRLKARMIK